MIDSLGVMTSTAIEASVLTDDRDLEALAAEWDELLEQSDQRAFFLRWSWNSLWWGTFRPADSHLFIITCRDSEGRLVGLAPFYWKQRRTAGIPHLREVLFLGTGIYAQTSEYLDIVARRGYEQAAADAVADFLSRDTGWDRLRLSEIPDASTVLPYLQQALGEHSQIAVCNRSYYIDTDTTWDTFKTNLAGWARDNVFRRTRRLFNSYESSFCRVETADQLEPALNALVRLHQARWRSKGEPGAFALTGAEGFLKEAARVSLSEGRLGLWTLALDTQVAAALLGFFDNGVLHFFQGGFDPAYSQRGLGNVMHGLCIRACVEDETVRNYDFMGGDNGYKQSWTKVWRESVCLTYQRPTLHSRVCDIIEQATRVGKFIIRKTVPKKMRVAAHKLIIKRRYYSNE